MSMPGRASKTKVDINEVVVNAIAEELGMAKGLNIQPRKDQSGATVYKISYNMKNAETRENLEKIAESIDGSRGSLVILKQEENGQSYYASYPRDLREALSNKLTKVATQKHPPPPPLEVSLNILEYSGELTIQFNIEIGENATREQLKASKPLINDYTQTLVKLLTNLGGDKPDLRRSDKNCVGFLPLINVRKMVEICLADSEHQKTLGKGEAKASQPGAAAAVTRFGMIAGKQGGAGQSPGEHKRDLEAVGSALLHSLLEALVEKRGDINKEIADALNVLGKEFNVRDLEIQQSISPGGPTRY